MPESLRDARELGKSGPRGESSQGVGGIPSVPPTPISSDQRRGEAADAYRRATWQIAKIVAAGLGLKASTLYNWTSGERRSPVESVDITTERALREGVERENALALVLWLAQRHLTAGELEQIAAGKRAEDDGRGTAIRLARTGIESIADDVAAGRITAQDAYAIGREVRRILDAAKEIDLLLQQGQIKSWPPTAGDG